MDKILDKMLVVSDGLFATFALFLFFSFAEISQTSGNQPMNGVDGMLGLNLLCQDINKIVCLGYKILFTS